MLPIIEYLTCVDTRIFNMPIDNAKARYLWWLWQSFIRCGYFCVVFH